MHDPKPTPVEVLGVTDETKDHLYGLMKSSIRRSAIGRLFRDDPDAHRMITQMAEAMATAYENNQERRGDGWKTADPDELTDLLADVSLDHLVEAVAWNGDKLAVEKEAADVALLAAMAAYRTLEIKRGLRAHAGKPFHGRFGVPDFNPNTTERCPECKALLWLDGAAPYCSRCDWREIEGHSGFQEERRYERRDGSEGVRPTGVPGRPETEREYERLDEKTGLRPGGIAD